MTWNPNFKKGVDYPTWDFLSMFPSGNSSPGTSNCWDGVRFMYWCVQAGTTTAGSASTTYLYRYDTWTDAWQYLVTLTSGNQGMDVEYDATRNVIYYMAGNGLTVLQCFNLNTVAVTINNISCAAWAATTLAVLPAAAATASSLTMPDESQSAGDLTVANGAKAIDTDAAAATSTATSIVGTAPGSFGTGMVGLYVRFTTGALAPNRRQITAVPNPTTLTVATFGAAPAAGDQFVVELPEGTATAGATTSLTDTTQAWTVNLYANQDVVIVAGTGAGQRRRIASNTATVLTLAAAVTGNARTGPFGVAPDATSVYRIVPSADFLYFQPGTTSGAIYRLDVAQTTGSAWSANLATSPAAPGGGANTMYAGAYDPFSILMARGSGTATLYRFQIGTVTWTTLPVFAGSENINTGASVAMLHGLRRLFFQVAGAQRLYAFDLTTGILEPFAFMPYAAPSAYDGKRARFVRTTDGVQFLYIMRAGGPEFFRTPVEWVLP